MFFKNYQGQFASIIDSQLIKKYLEEGWIEATEEEARQFEIAHNINFTR